MIATIFAAGGSALVRSDRIAGDVVTAGFPTWIADLALPIGFGLMAVRFAIRAFAAPKQDHLPEIGP